jgi:hypothetical protein
MAYKTRKTNKRKYLKRQPRRYSKRVYFGGEKVSNNNGFKAAKSADDIAGEKIMEKIQEQNEIKMPNVENIPIVGPAIEGTVDLVEGASVKGLDVVANSIGVDLNNPGSISKKLDDVNKAFSDPENVDKMKEIAGNAGQFAEVVVQASKPAIKEFIDGSGPIVAKGFNDAVRAGVATGVNILEDFAGPFIGIPRTLLSAATAFNASVNAGSEIVKGTSEAIQGTMENYERIKNEVKMPNTNIPDTSIPDTNILNTNIPDTSIPDTNIPDTTTSLKKMHNEAIKVGGRIRKSQLDFLTPHVNRAQMLLQYGGKWNTKRRHRNSHKITSRRY